MPTHLSVRLTWHDSAWNGCVCKNPSENVSCVLHEHIRNSRDLNKENKVKGEYLNDVALDTLPPCARDTGAYGDAGYTITHYDPLEHRRLSPCNEELPPYTCCPSAYRWMREDNIRNIMDTEGFELRPNDSGRESGWVYEPDRQRELLKRFWGKIEKKKSLIFYYVDNKNPLSEVHSRILIGIGRVKNIGHQLYFERKPPQYDDDFPVWSRSVTQNYPDEGVRLPYQEYLENNYNIDSILCPVPNSALSHFKYVAEHVSDDIAISVIEQFLQSVIRVKEDGLIQGDWDRKIIWLNDVLDELWKERGAFPGIGSILQYLGFRKGTAYQRLVLVPKMKQNENIWNYIKEILEGDREPEQEYKEGLEKAKSKWQKMASRHNLLALLARIEITTEQVSRVVNEEKRNDSRIFNTNDEILNNPYLICEQDIGTPDSDIISLNSIDHALMPKGYDALFPMKNEVEHDDKRRIRAIAVDVLKNAAFAGSTLLPLPEIINRIREYFPEKRRCEPDVDLIIEDKDFYSEVLTGIFENNKGWLGLEELINQEAFISGIVQRRSKKTNQTEWEEQVWKKALISHPKIGDPKSDREKRAIQEKVKALRTLYNQRISVLTGSAGTGKTTVLKVFIDKLEEIEGKQAILFLAPTGKARVKLSTVTKRNTYTAHQFLLKQGWLDPERFILNLESKIEPCQARTVIIDESSMLTVDILATLLKAVDTNSVTRLILVGDYNQLPPIGAGRPFAEIIYWLRENNPNCCANLETCMRTVEGNIDSVSMGLELANIYRSDIHNPADDELLSFLEQGKSIGDIDIKFWNNPDDLMEILKQSFSSDLGIKGYKEFSDSLGVSTKSWKKSESWQILSPTRRDISGTDELNRLIQSRFKGGLLTKARRNEIPKTFGDNEIIWSDKVIQLKNGKRKGFPRNTGIDYVANGEIGLVERTDKDFIQVYFSTQPDTSYRYYRGEDELLELAYALTVHKAQGSDFDIVYFILPQEASTLSRELMYTGLTRFRKKLILLVEKDINPLLNLRKTEKSDLEQRNTNMFQLSIKSNKQSAFNSNLIHRANNGVLMRSKSEVIVANILIDLGLNPKYEERLKARDNSADFRLPDFTISLDGDYFYWEHLGLLSDPLYKEAWERKKEWYKKNGYWEQVITSEDSLNGGIDSENIKKIAKTKILNE